MKTSTQQLQAEGAGRGTQNSDGSCIEIYLAVWHSSPATTHRHTAQYHTVPPKFATSDVSAIGVPQLFRLSSEFLYLQIDFPREVVRLLYTPLLGIPPSHFSI